MKIAEIAHWSLTHHANVAANYPDTWSSYEVAEEMKIIDRLTIVLGDRYEDMDVSDTLAREYDIEEVLESLGRIYIAPSLPGIDTWLDDNGGIAYFNENF